MVEEASNSLKIKVYNINNNKNIQNSQVVVQVQVLEVELLVSQEVVVVIQVLGFECPHQIVIMVMNTIIIIMVDNTKWPLIRVGGPRCQLLIKLVAVVILIAIHHPQPR